MPRASHLTPTHHPTHPLWTDQVINAVTITTTTIVSRDHHKAVEYFESAVSVDGHADAMVALAAMYAGWAGETVDLDRARELFTRAAEQGTMYRCLLFFIYKVSIF